MDTAFNEHLKQLEVYEKPSLAATPDFLPLPKDGTETIRQAYFEILGKPFVFQWWKQEMTGFQAFGIVTPKQYYPEYTEEAVVAFFRQMFHFCEYSFVISENYFWLNFHFKEILEEYEGEVVTATLHRYLRALEASGFSKAAIKQRLKDVRNENIQP